MSDYVLVDDDFEVFDVFPNAIVNLEVKHKLYVLRSDYDHNLLPGQETIARAYEQLRKDIPRCMFHMNGKKTSKILSILPCQLIRYCTQSVMALPLELLHQHSTIVAECEEKTPMYVYASEKTVDVEKVMRMYQGCVWNNIKVTVHVDTSNPCMLIQEWSNKKYSYFVRKLDNDKNDRQ